MQNSIISNRCITGLLKLIDQERHGETIDRNLIKNLLRMLLDLHVSFGSYSLNIRFHWILVVVSKRFRTIIYPSNWTTLSQRRSTTDSNIRNQSISSTCRTSNTRRTKSIDALHWSINKVRRTKKRAEISEKLRLIFRVQLIHLVETNLLTNHIKEILAKGFEILINENRFSSVCLMYELFSHVGQVGISELREAFGNYIKVKTRLSLSLLHEQCPNYFLEKWSCACSRCW